MIIEREIRSLLRYFNNQIFLNFSNFYNILWLYERDLLAKCILTLIDAPSNQDMLMTASPNGSNIMSQLSGSPNNVSDYYQHKGEVQPVPVAGLASTAFYDQVSSDATENWDKQIKIETKDLDFKEKTIEKSGQSDCHGPLRRTKKSSNFYNLGSISWGKRSVETSTRRNFSELKLKLFCIF